MRGLNTMTGSERVRAWFLDRAFAWCRKNSRDRAGVDQLRRETRKLVRVAVGELRGDLLELGQLGDVVHREGLGQRRLVAPQLWSAADVGMRQPRFPRVLDGRAAVQ